MSDQPTKTGDGVIDTHYCCQPGCKKWGGFGFSRGKAEGEQWWCWEHYPHKKQVNPLSR